MTFLTMADGPVANLPAGLDAYAGYTDDSGIGVTYPGVVAKFPAARHLSISVHGQAPALCGDVENGALASWAGYWCGYCSVSRVNALVAAYGRPTRLWTAHTGSPLGHHVCSPACWPGLVTTADGTQCDNNGGAWDLSLLNPDFFDTAPGGDMPLTAADEPIITAGTEAAAATLTSAVQLMMREEWVPTGELYGRTAEAAILACTQVLNAKQADIVAAVVAAVGPVITSTVEAAVAAAVAKLPAPSPLHGLTGTITFS